MLEVPRAAKVVFGPGAADRRKLLIAVHEELDLAFAPPAGVVDAPRQVGAYVVPMPAESVENRVDLAIGQGIVPTPLRVEIGGVFRNVRQRVVDLIVVAVDRIVAEVFERYPRGLPE